MWPVWSLITWTRFGGGLYRSIHSSLLKVLGTSTQGRFYLSDLIKIKAVPARAHREPAQASQFEPYSIATYLFSQARFRFFRFHRLVVRSSLVSRSAKSVASNALT
jgi:hypothetical protein